MNEPRSSFGSASLGEIAIVARGFEREHKILSSAEIYNSDTGTWESLPRMHRPRTMCSGVFMDGNFYVVGGIGVGHTVLTCGEMYDLGTRTWHVIPNMSPPQLHAAPMFAVVKNEIYAAFYAAFYSGNEVMKYGKGMNLWSKVRSLSERLARPWGMAFSAYGDQLIVIVCKPSLMNASQMKGPYSGTYWPLTMNQESRTSKICLL
ncbi:hypothetical protein Vadar_033651 [Vaccinium darrowii]|uniref:Uncharacterized protein n=1 Tax=Vaccinium darrowii TaxID=229202 RepID=A0ACB7X5Z1_9ERIC|nr:hypothetical protein Vadar_033651 [Vaccinium darrowii]